MLQWEWLGGLPPIRRAAVIGAGSWGTGLAVALARAGVEVDLGTRTPPRPTTLSRTRVNERYLPGEVLPDDDHAWSPLRRPRAGPPRPRRPRRPRPRAARGGRRPRRADPARAPACCVASKGLVAPHGALPSRLRRRAHERRAIASLGGPAHAADALDHGAALVVASARPRLLPPADRPAGQGRPLRRAVDRHRRRRARRRRQERRRAGRRDRRARRPQRRRRRRRARLRRGRRLRPQPRRARGHLRRPRRRRRPRRHRPGRRLPQPPRRRAARGRHARRGDRDRDRPDAPSRWTRSRCSPTR